MPTPTFDSTDVADLEEWRAGTWWSEMATLLGRDEIDGDGSEQSVLIDAVTYGLNHAFDAGQQLARMMVAGDRDEVCHRAGHPIVLDQVAGDRRIRHCLCGAETDPNWADRVTVTEAVTAVDRLMSGERWTDS